MTLTIREYNKKDISQMIQIWNQVVNEGEAFPDLEALSFEEGAAFFSQQTYTGVAEQSDQGLIVGVYILHPNNVGRCNHISNASYAVKKPYQGQGIGRKMVEHSLRIAKDKGFRLMQFNAVVSSNQMAKSLYEKMGFRRIGSVPEGFLNKNDEYEEIDLYYKKLQELT